MSGICLSGEQERVLISSEWKRKVVRGGKSTNGRHEGTGRGRIRGEMQLDAEESQKLKRAFLK